MRVKLKRTRLFTPPEQRQITVKYRAGEEYTVKRDWGEALIADGDASEVESPPREPEKRALTAAQVKALDRDGDGSAGGSLSKAST